MTCLKKVLFGGNYFLKNTAEDDGFGWKQCFDPSVSTLGANGG